MTDERPAESTGPRLTLDAGSILKLLAGERFYSAADAAIREAVLNAIDACGRGMASGVTATPRIEVIFDSRTLAIEIIDNGDGMSFSDIEKLFATVGASASRLSQFPDGKRYEAVGEFGIGVVSYFLAASEFDVHTRKPGSEPVALRFSDAMLDGVTGAVVLPEEGAGPGESGTRLRLRCRSPEVFELLRSKFPHWMRQVENLTAYDSATGGRVEQGSQEENVTDVDVPVPEWAERVRLGPPQNIGSWGTMDGKARVQLLYRGVFVMDYASQGPWGVRGTVWVNPKRFKPRLNRESFLADGLDAAMNGLLSSAHPQTLVAAAGIVARWPKHGDELSWNEDRWRTLWLAIPRGPAYAAAAAAWDAVLRSRRVIPLLEPQHERFVSYDDLLSLSKGEVYAAPVDVPRTDLMLRQAIATLRAQKKTVIRGVSFARGLMDGVSFKYSNLVELLVQTFASEELKIVHIAQIAQEVTTAGANVEGLFGADGALKVARLGAEGEAVALVGGQVWLNLDTAGGRLVVESIVNADEPISALVLSIMKESQVLGDRHQIVQRLLASSEFPEVMTPVRRICLRRVIA